jgi:carboxyl-terminal processing protease
VLQAIADLGKDRKLRGVVLDLRGSSGGDPSEVSRLLGAFTHGATWSYDCDVHGHCTPRGTDDTVPLLGLALVVLTDRNCVSACDALTGAVKDLRIGTLVGTRTAGLVSGVGDLYQLNDGSALSLPAAHHLSAATRSSTESASRRTGTSPVPPRTCPPAAILPWTRP